MAVRWRRSAIQVSPLPDHRPRDANAKTAARWEETARSPAAAQCAIATAAPAQVAATTRPHTNNPAEVRIGKTPGKRPAPQPRRRSAEESASQKAARSEKGGTRPGRRSTPKADYKRR